MNRISETTGGKIASAIKPSDAESTQRNSTVSSGSENSLSAGKTDTFNVAAEVAAFRDSTLP